MRAGAAVYLQRFELGSTYNTDQSIHRRPSKSNCSVSLKVILYCDNILAAGPDALITVSGKLESREWQGKHYPDFRVLNVEADDFL